MHLCLIYLQVQKLNLTMLKTPNSPMHVQYVHLLKNPFHSSLFWGTYSSKRARESRNPNPAKETPAVSTKRKRLSLSDIFGKTKKERESSPQLLLSYSVHSVFIRLEELGSSASPAIGFQLWLQGEILQSQSLFTHWAGRSGTARDKPNPPMWCHRCQISDIRGEEAARGAYLF